MLALLIMALLCLGIMFFTLAAIQDYSKKTGIGNKAANKLYGFFYILIGIAGIALVVLYII
jgi:hypothetical protein